MHRITPRARGWEPHKESRTRKRRLPWHFSFHDHHPPPAPKTTTAATAQSDETSSLTDSTYSGGLCMLGSGGGGGGGGGGASLSTVTSKKTLESLSSSVYEELQPFQRAHRALIKVSVHSCTLMCLLDTVCLRLSPHLARGARNLHPTLVTAVKGLRDMPTCVRAEISYIL